VKVSLPELAGSSFDSSTDATVESRLLSSAAG
jgi:hypothetical protein